MTLSPSQEQDQAPPDQGAAPDAAPPAAEASSPGSAEPDPWDEVRALGADPEEAKRAIAYAQFTRTPEGAQELARNVLARVGDGYFKDRLAKALGTHKGRKSLEHVLRQFKQENGGGGEGGDPETEVPPAASEEVQSLREELSELKSLLQQTREEGSALTSTLTRSAQIQKAAVASPLAVAKDEDFQAEVYALMGREPAAYAGPQGAARAIQAVARDWQAKAAKLGHRANGGPAPNPSPGGGPAPNRKPEERAADMKKLVRSIYQNPGQREKFLQQIAEITTAGFD